MSKKHKKKFREPEAPIKPHEEHARCPMGSSEHWVNLIIYGFCSKCEHAFTPQT